MEEGDLLTPCTNAGYKARMMKRALQQRNKEEGRGLIGRKDTEVLPRRVAPALSETIVKKSNSAPVIKVKSPDRANVLVNVPRTLHSKGEGEGKRWMRVVRGLSKFV